MEGLHFSSEQGYVYSLNNFTQGSIVGLYSVKFHSIITSR